MFARVTIGNVVFDQVNSFSIASSVKNISDTAVVVLAKEYKKLAGKPAIEYIKAGDAVKIECGYENDLHTEFTGFVKYGITSEFPLLIECDELYPLRQTDFTLSYEKVSLKQLLNDIAGSYKIECPDTNLGKLVIRHASTVEILNDLKDKWGLFTTIQNNVLSVGWPFDYKPSFTKLHTYYIEGNTKNARYLRYRFIEDYNAKVNIRITGTDGRNKTITAYSNERNKEDSRTVASIDARNITEADALLRAKSLLKQNVYEGFEGYLVGYCVPRVKPGDSVEIVNKRQPTRNGRYLVEAVNLLFSDTGGIDREVYISYKIA
ncbi:MAG: hypothetical protein EAZ35_02195 [Sphingobacteriia bacterium]|nr:MAG: hypothetical protein EAZ35_02195 [Sphingobacteriia bacterium]